MSIALVYDTETTGKILDWKKPLNPGTVSNFPRVTQIAWQMVRVETGEVLNHYQSLIKPDGWTIPKEQFFIDNNMSTERCEEFGAPMKEVLVMFSNCLKNSDIVVAHNLGFDMPVIGAELIRYDVSVGKVLKKVCTMQSTTDLLKLPGRYGYKYPKLIELYQYLFGKEMDGSNHDAMNDVVACKDCFLELIKLNKIVL